MGQTRRWPMTISDDERRFFVQLGARISELRTEHGFTQAQLASELGIAQQTLNSFERGIRRVPASMLPKLSEVLRTSVANLIGQKEKTSSKRGPKPKIQLQLEEIRRLPRAQQKLAEQMLDAILSQASAS